MSQRNRSTRSQRSSYQSQQPTTSRRARHDSSPEYSEEVQGDLRENEKKTYVVAVCKYILAMTKKKLPIKCAEVVKHCMHGETRLFSEIFPIVSGQLTEVSFWPKRRRVYSSS